MSFREAAVKSARRGDPPAAPGSSDAPRRSPSAKGNGRERVISPGALFSRSSTVPAARCGLRRSARRALVRDVPRLRRAHERARGHPRARAVFARARPLARSRARPTPWLPVGSTPCPPCSRSSGCRRRSRSRGARRASRRRALSACRRAALAARPAPPSGGAYEPVPGEQLLVEVAVVERAVCVDRDGAASERRTVEGLELRTSSSM